MLLKELIRKGEETVSVLYPEREAKEMVFAYMEAVLGIKRHTHIVEPDYMVQPDRVDELLRDFERMASGEPLQYIVGKSWFYGREFRVTPDVLIPRPETEILCDSVSAMARGRRNLRVLDLCTGSGCIAWTLALELPGAEVMAVDISDGALKVAASQDFMEEMTRISAAAPTFLKADILNELSDEHVSGLFDVIVSNPPYVMDSEKALMRPNVLEHEPHLALFVPDSDPLLFYRAVASHASHLLAENGFGMVEINEALGEETADVFRQKGFDASVVKDLHDKDRFICFSRKTK